MPTQTPDMECALRTSLGRSADSTHSSSSILLIIVIGIFHFPVQESGHQMQQLQTSSLVESWNQSADGNLWLSERTALRWVCSSTGEHAHQMVRIYPMSLEFSGSVLVGLPVVVVWRYVNGRSYFADLADALEQAKEEIFITDWWYVSF